MLRLKTRDREASPMQLPSIELESAAKWTAVGVAV